MDTPLTAVPDVIQYKVMRISKLSECTSLIRSSPLPPSPPHSPSPPYNAEGPVTKTRMHPSRMRTVHSSSHVYRSMHWAGGVSISACTGRGGCLHRGGVCQEGSAQGGVCLGGGCLPRGVCIPACTGAAPPVDRMTDRCKNITLPQLHVRCGR